MSPVMNHLRIFTYKMYLINDLQKLFLKYNLGLGHGKCESIANNHTDIVIYLFLL